MLQGRGVGSSAVNGAFIPLISQLKSTVRSPLQFACDRLNKMSHLSPSRRASASVEKLDKEVDALLNNEYFSMPGLLGIYQPARESRLFRDETLRRGFRHWETKPALMTDCMLRLAEWAAFWWKELESEQIISLASEMLIQCAMDCLSASFFRRHIHQTSPYPPNQLSLSGSPPTGWALCCQRNYRWPTCACLRSNFFDLFLCLHC
jgi:hypothetical protein